MLCFPIFSLFFTVMIVYIRRFPSPYVVHKHAVYYVATNVLGIVSVTVVTSHVMINCGNNHRSTSQLIGTPQLYIFDINHQLKK